jgi:hypothetical protein
MWNLLLCDDSEARYWTRCRRVYQIMRESNRNLDIPPGHTPGNLDFDVLVRSNSLHIIVIPVQIHHVLWKIGVQMPHPMYELEATAFRNFGITKFFFPSETLFNRSKPFSCNQPQIFQLSRFYRESPENSCNLPVSRFLSNSPDFSEYSGNIIKSYRCTVFSNIIVCLDLFWSCFMAIYRITYNNIVPICRKRHFRRLNFYYFFPEELDFNSLNSLPKFYLQWLECLQPRKISSHFELIHCHWRHFGFSTRV